MMNSPNEENPQDPLDPRLMAYLDQLRDVPPRDQQAVERGLQRFEAELSAFDAGTNKPGRNFWSRWAARLGVKEEKKMNMAPKKRRVLTYTLAIVLVIVLLFGGSAMTVLAAQSAIPGDALYPVKTSFEQTRYSLVGDAADRAELQIEYAGQRLEELERLIAAGRFQNVSRTTNEFEAHIRNALNELERVSDQDPARATALLSQITQSLTRYAGALSEMLANVPDPMRTDVLGALETLNATGGLQDGSSSGAQNANGNANDGLTGNANDGLTGNTNASRNANESPNLNERLNENQDTRPNENRAGGQNTNTNTNANENANPVVQPTAPLPTNPPAAAPAQNQNTNNNDNHNDNFNDNHNNNDDDHNDNHNGNDNDD